MINYLQEGRYDRGQSHKHMNIYKKILRMNICNSKDLSQVQRSKHVYLKLIIRDVKKICTSGYPWIKTTMDEK